MQCVPLRVLTFACCATLACTISAAPLCVSSEGIYCFGRAHLEPVWQRLQGRTTYIPVNIGESLFAGGNDGVVAFSGDGKRRWQITKFGHAFTPTVAHGQLFFGTLNGTMVGAGADGSVHWKRQFTGWMYSPAVIGDAVIGGGQAGVLHAVHRATGNSLWTLPLDQELVHRPVAVDGEHLVVTTFAGTLLKLEARAGRVVWRRAFGVTAKSPIVADRLLLSALFDGRLVALDASDGDMRWELALPDTVEVVTRGDFVVAFDDTQVTVVHTRDGQIQEHHEFASPIVAVRWLDDRRLAVFQRGLRNQVRGETVYLDRGNRHNKEKEDEN